MSVGDGMKMLISGGAVIPPYEAGKLKRDQKKKRTLPRKRKPIVKKKVSDSDSNSEDSAPSERGKSST
jgi:hypothetical protein